MKMKLNKDQVKKVAKLANLPIPEEEEEKYSRQLSKILEYIEQLNRADTSKVEPSFNITGIDSVSRDDSEENCLSQEEALNNAPDSKNGMFVTKGVFEK